MNGSQTWLTEVDDVTLEWRLHPVAGYRLPKPLSHYDLWAVTGALRGGVDTALPLGDEARPLTSLWDGLECFAAFGDDLEPPRLRPRDRARPAAGSCRSRRSRVHR